MKKTVIFTDLDGTLLDAESYSHIAALPALSLIAQRSIPLVLSSSKTRAEMEAFCKRLHNNHPFISENGGGIFIPPGYFAIPFNAEEASGYQLIRLGWPYAVIRKQFSLLREQYQAKVRGFGDMSVAEVAALTGLSVDGAALAKDRDFDEPFVFENEPDDYFLRAIEACGLRWTQGRIFHIMGNHDKGRAVHILLSLYQRQFGSIASIGLGDGYNDLPMLEAVDTPVLIKRKGGGFDARIMLPRLLKTRLPGPAGWNETMLQLLSNNDGGEPPAFSPQTILIEVFNAALAAVNPYEAVLKSAIISNHQLKIAGAIYDLKKFERVLVVGAGKASARMAQAIEALFGEKITAGLIIVKDGHTAPLSVIKQVEASHPVPNEAGIEGTQHILRLLGQANETTLVICLLSGGASALLVSPADGITLQDKQEATRLLLNAGASITELNAVRKHLSAVKGGQLAQAAYPAQVVTLILSDVIGDPIGVIASGPTAQDDSAFADAWAVIEKYGLQQNMPARVLVHLRRGIAGLVPETVKQGAPCLATTRNVIIGSIRQALGAAKEEIRQLGFAPQVISDTLQGEARDAARFLAQAARTECTAMRPGEQRGLLCGGETTVTVRGNGKGGRNQELALAFALEVDGMPGVSLLSAGTDGSDGPTDAAGATVDGKTAAQARSIGLDPLRYLDNNDSYAFFQQLDAATDAHSHFKTGPTGTNVMDIQIILLNK
jgi:glycerate 2-kinase